MPSSVACAFSRPASILHGGQDAIERRQQLESFLDGTTSILLATDVAGQGLNLQSRARWVISLELPWNPARLEQRIGRVDRISQTRPTHFTCSSRATRRNPGCSLICPGVSSARAVVRRRRAVRRACHRKQHPRARCCSIAEPDVAGVGSGTGVAICRRWAASGATRRPSRRRPACAGRAMARARRVVRRRHPLRRRPRASVPRSDAGRCSCSRFPLLDARTC